MNIKDFEEHINSTILERGYDYYIGGNISECTHEDDNTYIFEVEGTEDYEVVIKLDDNGEIIYSECDCPYDFGPVCKHEVSAYYKLLDYINKINLAKKTKKTKKDKLEEVLNSLSKEELIHIVVDLAKKDKMFNDSLILKYLKGDNEKELKNCKKLIKSIVKKYCGRGDFISYRQAYYFACDMDNVLEKSISTEDIMLSVDIALLVLDEAIEAFQYADDSNGDIGMLVSKTMETISTIIDEDTEIDIKVKRQLFKKLLKKSESEIFDGWNDFRISMFKICAQFADIKEFREKLTEKIESMIDSNSDNEYKKYSNESMLHILYEIIDDYGTKEESEEFIHNNINFSSFRELLINKYIAAKNYEKVIELTFEGEKQDKKYPGLIHKWEKIRYDAYKNLAMKKEQEELGRELLIQGDVEYYKDLKELADNKKEFYDDLKEELKNSKDWRSEQVLIDIIYRENDIDEIMDYVRNNKASIEKHVDAIKDKFYDEAIGIYKDYIKYEAERSNNRSHYKGVCAIIKRYKKIAGKGNAQEIINQLKEKYIRRPAFLDELGKIK